MSDPSNDAQRPAAIPFKFRIYEEDELVCALVFDGSDPSTYVVCETEQDIEKAFASMRADAESAA